MIKNGTDGLHAITPARQEQATFYGLAKAAGDTTQSQSDNAVGTYTAEAKAAIQQMLDVPSNDDIPDVPVQDVQVNGTSVVTDGVANVPYAALGVVGAVSINSDFGIMTSSVNNTLMIRRAYSNTVQAGTNLNQPIVPECQHLSTFYGLAKAAGADMASIASTTVGIYPEAQKSAISQMLNGPVSVSGSTPSITALPGVQYVCGEVATLDITLPASGCIDVVFESGSTPTVLTVTPPTGVTVKWANGFDPTALEADTTYEINICNGLGVAGSWT